MRWISVRGTGCEIASARTAAKGASDPQGASDLHCFLFSFSLPHRAAAALRAISRRRFGVRLAARALPPTRPPLRAHSCRSAAVIEAALSFAKATAAGFFFVFTTPIIHELN